MKIIIDRFIPYIQGVLEPYAEVIYATPEEFTPMLVRHADALIIRTRVHCNANLLADTSVRFIATATIGHDHIDADFCKQKNITWCSAPGCNADGVRQYIQTALEFFKAHNNILLEHKTIGIIGVGHIGKRIAEMAEKQGMKVLLNDPPRARAEGNQGFVDLEQIIKESDIITFHTPLNLNGTDKTYQLCNTNFLSKLKPKALIINAARGGIIDEKALLETLKVQPTLQVVLDCWENEPNINRELLQKVLIGTPHIAGYTIQGKANATTMSIQALSRFFDLDLNYWQADTRKENISDTYDILTDYKLLQNNSDKFEQLRSSYKFR